MKLNVSHENDVLVIEPQAGHLDASNVKQFREAVFPLIENQPRVVLDMRQLDFVDSAGLGAMIACRRSAAEQQGQLRLCSLSRPVRALFDLMRMHRVFDIHDQRDEAIRALA